MRKGHDAKSCLLFVLSFPSAVGNPIIIGRLAARYGLDPGSWPGMTKENAGMTKKNLRIIYKKLFPVSSIAVGIPRDRGVEVEFIEIGPMFF